MRHCQIVHKIVALIKKLSDEERNQLLLIIRSEFEVPTSSPNTTKGATQMVYDLTVAHFKSNGINSLPPMSRLRAKIRNYDEFCKEFMEFVDSHFGSTSKIKLNRMRVAQYFIVMIYNYYNKWNGVVSIWQVSKGLPSVAGYFEQAFPGYLKNGLGPMVIEKVLKGNK